MPNSADLVTDLPADFNVFGQGVDTSMQDLLGGTTGQVLSKTSATNMDFTWITPQVGDITGVTAGTGISGGGTSGTVTVTNDMATTITAAGDIVVGTGSGTYDNLPIGTTNQILTADTTVSPYKVKWATPAVAASGLTKIVSGSFTGVAAVAINGCFTSTYKKYLLVVGGISDSTDPGEIYLQLQYSTSTVHSANYFSCSDSRNENGTLTTLTASNTTKWILGKARLADDRHQFTATFTNVGNSAQNGAFSCYGNLGNQGYNIAGGMVNSNQTWTGIYLSGQGNIDGEYTVYGLEN